MPDLPSVPGAIDDGGLTEEESALQEAGLTWLNAVFSLSRALRLYSPNNAAVHRIIEDFQRGLDAWFARGEEQLQLRVLDGEAFVNGRLLRLDPVLYERVVMLRARLHEARFNELTALVGLTRDEVDGFVEDFSAMVKAGGSAPDVSSRPHLVVGLAKGDAIASFRFEPDLLAVWLYRTLLNLVDSLYEQHHAGRAPSLLPLRRNLQLVIDAMRDHSAIFQLLTTVVDPRDPPSLAARRAMIAVELMAFGRWAGMAPRELLAVGLAGVLGGLIEGDDPTPAIAALLRFGGLGDAAVPLTIVLYDTVAVRRGEAVDVPGQAVALVEHWITQVTASATRPARAHQAVLKELARGEPVALSRPLVAAFVQFKGVLPLGSLVKLEPGGPAVVVNVGGPDGRKRPVVVLVNPDATAGAVIDLAGDPAIQIVGIPDPATVPLRPDILLRPDPDEIEQAPLLPT